MKTDVSDDAFDKRIDTFHNFLRTVIRMQGESNHLYYRYYDSGCIIGRRIKEIYYNGVTLHDWKGFITGVKLRDGSCYYYRDFGFQ